MTLVIAAINSREGEHQPFYAAGSARPRSALRANVEAVMAVTSEGDSGHSVRGSQVLIVDSVLTRAEDRSVDTGTSPCDCSSMSSCL